MKGDVVVIPFPFSDLSGTKRRPALVVADLTGVDVTLCQITSQSSADGYAIAITEADFDSGQLQRDSFVRPNRLFTADSRTILYVAGKLSTGKSRKWSKRLLG